MQMETAKVTGETHSLIASDRALEETAGVAFAVR
jgi:hypothetical protein